MANFYIPTALISVDGSVQIGDFGFARVIEFDELSKTYCGSTAYTAPEVLKVI